MTNALILAQALAHHLGSSRWTQMKDMFHRSASPNTWTGEGGSPLKPNRADAGYDQFAPLSRFWRPGQPYPRTSAFCPADRIEQVNEAYRSANQEEVTRPLAASRKYFEARRRPPGSAQ